MNSSFVYENIRMETPLRGRSGEHAGTAPTCFVWVDCVWAVDVVWMDCVEKYYGAW